MVSKRDPGTRVSARGKPSSRLGPAPPKGLPFVPILRTLTRIQHCQNHKIEAAGAGCVCAKMMVSCVGLVSK